MKNLCNVCIYQVLSRSPVTTKPCTEHSTHFQNGCIWNEQGSTKAGHCSSIRQTYEKHEKQEVGIKKLFHV